MLVGKVVFGHPTNRYIPLYKAELFVPKIFSMDKMLGVNCSTLLKTIKKDEYLGWDTLDKDSILEKMKEDLKYFEPRWVTTFEWSLDKVENTLETYFNDEETDLSMES